MQYNFHTHTRRCGHAQGTEEEYILRAIECKVKKMGFSDHIPLKFPDGSESEFRVPDGEGKAYVNDLLLLKEKYKSQIEIHIGFESEYYPEFFDYMLNRANQFGAEYLILGQHFVIPELYQSRHSTSPTDSVELLREFVNSLIAGAKTKKFTYIAHPDMFNFTGDVKAFKREMRELCKACVEYNVPIELNLLGIRGNRFYPREDFWETASVERTPCVFGFDAHKPVDAYDGASFEKAMDMVKRLNLNYIGEPELVII